MCVYVCKMLYLWLSYEELIYPLLNKHNKVLIMPLGNFQQGFLSQFINCLK